MLKATTVIQESGWVEFLQSDFQISLAVDSQSINYVRYFIKVNSSLDLSELKLCILKSINTNKIVFWPFPKHKLLL